MPGGFNPANYEQVDSRLDRFWSDHPNGRVLPECTFNDGTTFVFRVEIYDNREDARPVAIGHATETVTDRGVNSTSALENCETSAVGRALANLNYAPKGQRPSREEMAKTETARGANGNGRPQNGTGQGGNAAAGPAETPAQRTTRLVGRLLSSQHGDEAKWWVDKITEYQLTARDATALVSAGTRQALKIDPQVPLTAGDVSKYVTAYVKEHGAGPEYVREPAPSTG